VLRSIRTRYNRFSVHHIVPDSGRLGYQFRYLRFYLVLQPLRTHIERRIFAYYKIAKRLDADGLNIFDERCAAAWREKSAYDLNILKMPLESRPSDTEMGSERARLDEERNRRFDIAQFRLSSKVSQAKANAEDLSQIIDAFESKFWESEAVIYRVPLPSKDDNESWGFIQLAGDVKLPSSYANFEIVRHGLFMKTSALHTVRSMVRRERRDRFESVQIKIALGLSFTSLIWSVVWSVLSK
jgi:hypothetical protein